MSPDIQPSARAYHDTGDGWPKARDVDRQQQDADRQHPESEDREDGQETANDQRAGDWNPELAEPPAQEWINDPAGCRELSGYCCELTMQAVFLVNHLGLIGAPARELAINSHPPT
jgi:hypothetical protein